MRTISYKCDRCGKVLSSKTAIKLNISMQNGPNPVEKKTRDFCKGCYKSITMAYHEAMKSVDPVAVEKEPIVKPVVQEPAKPSSAQKPVAIKHASGQEPVQKPVEKPVEAPRAEGKPVADAAPEKQSIEKFVRTGESEIKLGSIKDDEKQEILRLYVEEDMLPDDIAAKMNRLPRGIKRAINTAEKTGELEKLRNAFMARQMPGTLKEKQENDGAQSAIHNLLQGDVVAVPDDEEDDVAEHNTGSGATNAGIVKDAYVVPPQREVINGKKYDVGCILALAKAGWPSSEIADEKHYDEGVVADIIRKYV